MNPLTLPELITKISLTGYILTLTGLALHLAEKLVRDWWVRNTPRGYESEQDGLWHEGEEP